MGLRDMCLIWSVGHRHVIIVSVSLGTELAPGLAGREGAKLGKRNFWQLKTAGP